MRIRIRRVYEPLQPDDGTRVLVDRLWPRGMAKAKLPQVHWMKDVAPSNALRESFAHQPGHWAQFRTHYFAELDANHEPVEALRKLARHGQVTLLYAARDEQHNNALALQAYLLARHG